MQIHTVTGWREASVLRITYCHEHVHLDLSGHKHDSDTNFNDLDAVVAEFVRLGELGVGTVIDVSNRGMGRDVEAMLRVSRETGVEVVASTGFYKEPFLPEYFYRESEQALVNLLLADIRDGIDESGVCAHVIGEIGTGKYEFSADQHKLFRVAAAAHCETGHPIYTHTTLGTMALEQLEFLKARGVDLTRVAIGHLDLKCDNYYHQQVADYGCFIAFDTVGKLKYESDENRALHLLALVESGHLGQILLSQDITRKSHLQKNGGIGYSYLLTEFVPLLREHGLTEAEINTILVENPKKFLAVSRRSG